MGHGKETPRQKMIGLMYLFLTCMLALNVSKDVLDAFILINGKLQTTNENFISKNDIAYKALEKAASSNPTKAGPSWNTAQQIKIKADSLVNQMQYYKELIISTADKLDMQSLEVNEKGKRVILVEKDGQEVLTPIEDVVNSKDNTDVAAQIMYGQENNGEGQVLRALIENFKEYILANVDTTKVGLRTSIQTSLSTEGTKHDNITHAWESQNFEHLPLMAVITNLTQMQTAVRNVEGDFVSYKLSNLDAESFKFNKLAPIVIPNSTYIMQGGEYNAQIFLGAFDTTKAPIVEIGSQVYKGADGNYKVRNGQLVEIDPATNMAILKRRGSGLGTQKYEGLIKIKSPSSDDTLYYPFKQEYQVAQSSVVVSPTKMNVFYVGVDNPVEISVPGIPGDDIVATMSGGSIRKAGKIGYVVKCPRPGKATINVSAKIEGKTKSMGSKEFRIKPVPDPVATIWGMEGGNIDAAKLRAAKRIDAKMKNFDFDLQFDVTSYIASTKVGDYVIDAKGQGSRISSDIKSKIFAKLKKGQKVYFEEIKAIGPDKKPRQLGIIMFKIQ